MHSNVMRLYVGALIDSVISCSIATLSYDLGHISTFAHLTYTIVDGVFKVVFHTSFDESIVVAECVVLDFYIRSIDARSASLLRITID